MSAPLEERAVLPAERGGGGAVGVVLGNDRRPVGAPREARLEPERNLADAVALGVAQPRDLVRRDALLVTH